MVTSRPSTPPPTNTANDEQATATNGRSSKAVASVLKLFFVRFFVRRSGFVPALAAKGSAAAFQRGFRGETLGFLPLLRRRRDLCGGVEGPSTGESMPERVFSPCADVVRAGGGNPGATIDVPAHAFFVFHSEKSIKLDRSRCVCHGAAC